MTNPVLPWKGESEGGLFSRRRLFCARRGSTAGVGTRGTGTAVIAVSGVALPALFDNGRHPLLVFPPVLLVELGSHAVGRAVGVGLVQQGLDRRQDGRHVVGGTPPVLEDVQANACAVDGSLKKCVLH